MGLHDLKARELQVEEIVNPDADNLNPVDVSVKYGILKYNQANTFLDGSNNPLDPFMILDAGTVVYLIGLASGGSGLITQNKTEADLLYDGTLLQYYLPVTLTTNQLVVAVSSDVTGTKDQIQFSMTNGRIYGFADNTTQNIIVKIG